MVNILGVKVDETNTTQILRFVRDRVSSKKPFYIVTPNPEIIVAAQKDEVLRDILNRSDISIPDGIGLLFVSQKLTLIKGRELFMDLIKLSNKMGWRVVMVGYPNANKAQEMLEKSLKQIKLKSFLGAKYDNDGKPVSEIDIKIHNDMLSEIQLFKPQLIFLGLGCPRQEKWIKNYFEKSGAIGAMVVGGSFDYLVKNKRPGMGMYYFEWLWRLILEPKRIKRILTAVIVFPWQVFRNTISPLDERR